MQGLGYDARIERSVTSESSRLTGLPPVRQGSSGPAARTRAGGALRATRHNISQNQVYQEGQ